MNFVHHTVVAQPHLPSVQSAPNVHFGYCGQGLVPMLLRASVGQGRAYSWTVSVISPDACLQTISRAEIAQKYRALSLSFFWEALLISGAKRSDVCPSQSAGAAVRQMCVIIWPTPQGKSYFGVIVFTIRASCKMRPGWSCFAGTPAQWGFLNGVIQQENAGVSAQC